MDSSQIRWFLLWCLVFNCGVLGLWFLFFCWKRDFIYRIHSKWFKLNPEQFDAIHYTGMVVYKVLIFVLNIVPLGALWLVR